jgi:hypothetical protein
MKRISLPAPAPPPSGHDSEYGWHRRALAAEARVETLEKALRGVMDLIDSQHLVRNINNDGSADWALRMLSMVKILADAAAALEATP